MRFLITFPPLRSTSVPTRVGGSLLKVWEVSRAFGWLPFAAPIKHILNLLVQAFVSRAFCHLLVTANARGEAPLTIREQR
jgi:hypothetical protein